MNADVPVGVGDATLAGAAVREWEMNMSNQPRVPQSVKHSLIHWSNANVPVGCVFGGAVALVAKMKWKTQEPAWGQLNNLHFS